MKRLTLLFAIFVLAACSSQLAPTEMMPTVTPVPSLTPTPIPLGLPGPVIPEGLGLNIHFVYVIPREFDQIAEAGFRFIRIDLVWQNIEYSEGNYDFSEYDILVESMSQWNIRIMFLFNYYNRLYDYGLSPFTDQGRKAFTRFATAAVERYAGKGILWDIGDEVNGAWSWKPKPNIQDFAKYALETINAIKQADPNAMVLGVGLCCFEDMDSWEFYDELGKLGVLNKFDAITIHPYSSMPEPEIAETYYPRLRQILDKYSPERKIPIVSGEWGFNSSEKGETQQADYLARSWLINLANDANLSIWYDWSDDSFAHNIGDCYGIVDYELKPKPAYFAAKTLAHTLDGYHFLRRITTTNAEDFLFLFGNNSESILVAWTTGDAHTITLVLSGDSLARISVTGETSTLTPNGNGFTIELNGSPQYLQLGTRTIP